MFVFIFLEDLNSAFCPLVLSAFLTFVLCFFFPLSNFCWQSGRQGSLAKIVYRLFLSLLLGEMLIKSLAMKVDLLIFLGLSLKLSWIYLYF